MGGGFRTIAGHDAQAVGKFVRDTLPETVRHFAGMHWGSQLVAEPVESMPAPP
jgi:hypothetical protein